MNYSGRVHALNPVDALDKIHERMADMGLQCTSPVSLTDQIPQPGELVWYEFRVGVVEVGL
jgi:hypothetical protein